MRYKVGDAIKLNNAKYLRNGAFGEIIEVLPKRRSQPKTYKVKFEFSESIYVVDAQDLEFLKKFLAAS